MSTEHVGVVSGLPDLANFLASVKRHTADTTAASAIRVILFGHDVSLPDPLRQEFDYIARTAFPRHDVGQIPSNLIRGNTFHSDQADSSRFEKNGYRILYGNSIQKPLFLDLYGFLQPDEFVFFDNGLSSYWPHDTDIQETFAYYNVPLPVRSYLSLHPPLPLPRYLADVPSTNLKVSDFDATYRRMADAAYQKPTGGSLPSNVILGTSLFRTNRISWEDERNLYLDLISTLHRESNSPILFKTHPRAVAQPLIGTDDGVEVLNTIAPVEAFAEVNPDGFAYSISSTSLFTLQKYYQFTPFRLDSPAVRKVAERMRHLDLAFCVPAFFD